MLSSPASDMLDTQACEQARLSRDVRFDGLFFTAVTSTGIYCRPVCPAPPPKPSNIVYYRNAAAAEAAGFRPCLRCRPELSPADGSWRRGDAAMARALKLIESGALAELSLAELAAKVHLGERQLRRLFNERLGATPVGVHGTHRLLFAKQLLTETDLPITEVALAAGFGSLTRFNTSFREAYRMAPRELRKHESSSASEVLTLRLNYRPPYDLGAMLDFLRGRALPGVEHVDAESYSRIIGTADAPGWLRVSRWPNASETVHALQLQLHNVHAPMLLQIVQRLRRMFDLDADPQAIAQAFATDPRLHPLLHKRPGLRLPSGWDGFEIAVRAVIGQQVSVAAARTVTARVAQRFGTAISSPFSAHLTHLFPTADALADADLSEVGLTRARAQTVRTVAQALLAGTVDFRPEQTLDEFVDRWVALPGIGPWTANYMALRALGHPDAFPAEDLVLQRALPNDGSRLSAKALREQAEAWRPWRAYAVIHLWRDSMPAAKPMASEQTAKATQKPASKPRDSTARSTATRTANSRRQPS